MGRWSLAGSRGPTWGDQGPRRTGRGLESWGHFVFLRSPAGCSCPLLLVPCPSLWLSGFVEAELKKLLVVQRESRLWKMGGYDGRELLTQPEITLEEAGIVDGQVHPPSHHPALLAGPGAWGWRPPLSVGCGPRLQPPTHPAGQEGHKSFSMVVSLRAGPRPPKHTLLHLAGSHLAQSPLLRRHCRAFAVWFWASPSPSLGLSFLISTKREFIKRLHGFLAPLSFA